MIHDVWTVARKEWLEIIDQLLRFKRGGWSVLLIVGFLGVVSPLQMGESWLSSPLMFFYWPLLTSSMTSTLIADAIAHCPAFGSTVYAVMRVRDDCHVTALPRHRRATTSSHPYFS